MAKILTLLITLCIFCATDSIAQQKRGQRMLVLARQGKVSAMSVVARCYYSGIEGLPKDTKKALFWARKGAQNNDVFSMHLAASWIHDLMEKGEKSERLYWALKGANRSSIELQMMTALCYQALGNQKVFSEEQGTYIYKYDSDKRTTFYEEAITWASKAKDQFFANPTVIRDAKNIIGTCSEELELLNQQNEIEDK